MISAFLERSHAHLSLTPLLLQVLDNKTFCFLSNQHNTVWVKKSFLRFTDVVSPKRLRIFSPNFTRLFTRSYLFSTTIFVLNHLQRWRRYAILSATTQFTSYAQNVHHQPMHVGWSHLIWHDFVTVGDNWIKICRQVKFGLKIPNHLGKNVRKPPVDF